LANVEKYRIGGIWFKRGEAIKKIWLCHKDKTISYSPLNEKKKTNHPNRENEKGIISQKDAWGRFNAHEVSGERSDLGMDGKEMVVSQRSWGRT